MADSSSGHISTPGKAPSLGHRKRYRNANREDSNLRYSRFGPRRLADVAAAGPGAPCIGRPAQGALPHPLTCPRPLAYRSCPAGPAARHFRGNPSCTAAATAPEEMRRAPEQRAPWLLKLSTLPEAPAVRQRLRVCALCPPRPLAGLAPPSPARTLLGHPKSQGPSGTSEPWWARSAKPTPPLRSLLCFRDTKGTGEGLPSSPPSFPSIRVKHLIH